MIGLSIGTRRRKQNRKRINYHNFMREMAKNEKLEIMCCQTHTTVRPVGTNRACGSQLAHTTVWPVQAPETRFFSFLKIQMHSYELQTPKPT